MSYINHSLFIILIFYLEYDDPDGDSDELGMVKPGDARLGLTLGHWCPGGGVLDAARPGLAFGHWCPGGGVLDAAVSASDHILGLVGGSGMPQSWWWSSCMTWWCTFMWCIWSGW